MAYYNGKSTTQMTKSEVVAALEQMQHENQQLNEYLRRLRQRNDELSHNIAGVQSERNGVAQLIMKLVAFGIKHDKNGSRQLVDTLHKAMQMHINDDIDNAMQEHNNECRHEYTDPYR